MFAEEDFKVDKNMKMKLIATHFESELDREADVNSVVADLVNYVVTI